MAKAVPFTHCRFRHMDPCPSPSYLHLLVSPWTQTGKSVSYSCTYKIYSRTLEIHSVWGIRERKTCLIFCERQVVYIEHWACNFRNLTWISSPSDTMKLTRYFTFSNAWLLRIVLKIFQIRTWQNTFQAWGIHTRITEIYLPRIKFSLGC